MSSIAPQRCALFRHLNFQKWSEHGVLCYILTNLDFEMCFAPQTACTCSSLIWPDGSAPATLASLLFAPPEPQIIGKNTVFRDFPTFSRIWASLFWLFLTLLWSSLFYSDSFRLFFSSVHIVGSLTSKLPSIIFDQYIPVISHDLPRATRDLLWDIMGSNPLEGKRMKHVMGKQRWNHEILGSLLAHKPMKMLGRGS